MSEAGALAIHAEGGATRCWGGGRRGGPGIASCGWPGLSWACVNIRVGSLALRKRPWQ
jgi:hypothetical protein